MADESPTKSCAADDVHLSYTIDDDGVHLCCQRRTWDHNLGFSATVTDVIREVDAHIGGKHT